MIFYIHINDEFVKFVKFMKFQYTIILLLIIIIVIVIIIIFFTLDNITPISQNFQRRNCRTKCIFNYIIIVLLKIGEFLEEAIFGLILKLILN